MRRRVGAGVLAAPASAALAPAALQHLRAKGRKRELGHLEELQTPGDAHDGDAVERSGNQVRERHPQACEQDPRAVGDERRRTAAVDDGLAKRHERERRHLEGLEAQGYPDDGDAEYPARDQPTERGAPSAGEQPDDVECQRQAAAVGFLHDGDGIGHGVPLSRGGAAGLGWTSQAGGHRGVVGAGGGGVTVLYAIVPRCA